MLRTHPLQNNKSQNTTKDAVCITQYIPSRIRPLAKKRDGDYEALEALYPSQKYRTLASFCALSAVLFGKVFDRHFLFTQADMKNHFFPTRSWYDSPKSFLTVSHPFSKETFVKYTKM